MTDQETTVATETDPLLTKLREAVQRHGSMSAFARAALVSPQVVRRVLADGTERLASTTRARLERAISETPKRRRAPRMPTDDVCRRCGETKPVSEFVRDRTRPHGYRRVCKPCYREAARAAARAAEAANGTVTQRTLFEGMTAMVSMGPQVAPIDPPRRRVSELLLELAIEVEAMEREIDMLRADRQRAECE